MARALKILLVIIIVFIVIVGVALYVFLQTFDVAKYKTQIVREASTALNRDVQLEDIALNFSLDKGIALTVKGLRIADNPQFSGENFLTVKEINLGVDVEPLVSKRKIRVSNIVLGSPKIVIIRNKDGLINASTIGKREEESKSSNPTPTSEVVLVSAKSEQPGARRPRFIPTFLIDTISIKNGVVIYRDESFDPPVMTELVNVNLTVEDFSLAKQSKFSLQASIFSALKKNISVEGSMLLDAENTTVSIKDVDTVLDLSGISAKQINEALPMIADAGLEGKLEGKIECTADEITITDKGLQKASVDGKLQDGKVKLKYVGIPFKPINAAFEMTQERLTVTESSFGLGEGEITIVGRIEDLLGKQRFKSDMDITDVDLAKTIAQEDQSTQFHGKLQGKFSVSGRGLGNKAIDSATGSGTIKVTDGKLTNINVLKLVLSKVSMISNLDEKIEKNLPEKYKKKLDEKDTEFKPISINTTIRDGSLVVDRADIESDTFMLSGSGNINFDQTMSLDTSLTVPEDLTKSLVDSVEEFRFLVNRQGKMYIPVKVSGKVSSPRFFPDMEYLTKTIIMDRGREELQKVLKKVFKKDEEDKGEATQESAPAGTDSNAAGEQTPQTEEQQQEERSPEEKLIDSILDTIFK